MAAIGGSIESINIAGREFAVAADSDVGRKLGGRQNEIEMNGDGSGRIIQTPQPWTLDGLTVQVDDARGDQEFLQNVANGTDFETVVITYASGKSYQGRGTIVGDVAYSNRSATASVSLAGVGQLTQQ
jgi:hypothetical protein